MNKDTIQQIQKRDDVPEFVKNASLDDLDEVSRKGFAGGKKDYPIYKKAAAWMSAARYGGDEEENELVEQELRKAARVHGFDYEKAAETFQEEPEPVDYLLEKEANGQTVRLMPVAGPENLKDAAEYLAQNRSNLPYEWRKEAAQKILNRAEDEEVDVPHREYLTKAAGWGVSYPDQVREAFRVRAQLVDHGVREDLMKCASGWQDDMDLEDHQKCAEVLARVDEEHDLHHLYGGVLETPEEEACSITRKEAEQEIENSVALDNGDVIYRDDVDRQTMSKAAAAVGGDFADEMPIIPDWESFKKAAKNLGTEDSETVSSIIESTG